MLRTIQDYPATRNTLNTASLIFRVRRLWVWSL